MVVRVADLLDINATSSLTTFGTLIAGTLDGSGSSGAITLNGGAAITTDDVTTFANDGGLTLNALLANQFTDPTLSTATLASGPKSLSRMASSSSVAPSTRRPRVPRAKGEGWS